MLRQPIQMITRFCFVVSCAILCFAPSLNGAVFAYRSYTAPEGTHYFALGLQASEQPALQPPEVAFLIDTAASQTGQTRLDTLEAVVSAINQLPEGTKIQILAMDVDTEPLTAQFAVKGSPEVEAALRVLYRRVPLGAVDLGKGLQAVRSAFDGGAKDAQRSVLYFGSGRSMAKTISPAVFEQEAKNFTEQKITFTACATGMQANLGFIAAFANRTGGNLIDLSLPAQLEEAVDWHTEQDKVKVDVDWKKVNWKKIGKQIADSATATVVWVDPDSVQFPEGCDVYPVQIQPIRSDRATILVGKTESEALPAFNLTLTGTTADSNVTLPFQLLPEKKSGNEYLRAVVETAAKDGGAVMPLVGWDSLLQIQEMFISVIEDQISKADTAIETDNLPQALTILEDVLRAEPGNKIAQNMFSAAQEQMNEHILSNVIAQDLEIAELSTDVVAGDVPAASYIDGVTTVQSAMMQKIQKEVEAAMINAQKRSTATYPDFDGAIQELKLTQQMIRDNAALEPGRRDVLVDRLGHTLKQIEHEKYAQEYRSIEEDSKRATERSLAEANRVLEENKEKIAQIFDRFNALMQAEEYKAAWAVGDQAVELAPDHPAPYVARRLAQMVSYADEYEKLRHQRHIGFLETFMAAERSFIPVSDEPPLTYIDRERWQLLSAYRKEKYSTVSLADPEESIKMIKSVLESRDIRLNIDETTTFADLFKMIKDELRRLKMPDIYIALDTVALKEAGEIQLDTPVAPDGFEHPRMRLRNVLRRLLSPHELTYIIREESLLITTVDEARRPNNMIIKVYPIADIYMLEMGGGGMMGGMMGGMGGMGGMMGGMGGGMMNFADIQTIIMSVIEPNSWPMMGGDGDAFMSFHYATQSLAIRQTEEVHAQIEDLLSQIRKMLDLQIAVEVRYITLSDSFFERMGVAFDMAFNNDGAFGRMTQQSDFTLADGRQTRTLDTPATRGDNVVVGLEAPRVLSATASIPVTQDSFGMAIPAFGGFNPTAGISTGFALLSNIETYLFISAAQGDRRNSVMEAPKVMLQNGQPGMVNDTTQIPFVTSVTPVVADFAVSYQPVITMLNQGQVLHVRADVSRDRQHVLLTLNPTFSTLIRTQTFKFFGDDTDTEETETVRGDDTATTSTDPRSNATRRTTSQSGVTIQQPIWATFSVMTTVSCPDGGTVLLGGIKRLSEGRVEGGVPILNKLPYIQRLFSNTAIGRDTQSIMIMVTPRIIIQEEEESFIMGSNSRP